ncbi:hypothetical protein [Clostridium bornimense]|uniref:hypothetical protein n=1 Tax=Clostridium bornimense TaxID=1216932 RepID=UPI000B0256D6|nr:hypothetical protein [Clostridium bornimense]
MLQDKKNPNMYYLEIYDSNSPYNSVLGYDISYVTIEKYHENENRPCYKYDAVDYNFDYMFGITNVRNLEEYIKNY